MNLYDLAYGQPRLLRHTLTAPVKGLRIGFLTDLHVTRYREKAIAERVIEPFSREETDLLLLGGDYGETREGEEIFFRLAASLRPRYGSFAILGNNDKERFGSSFPLIRRMAEKAGIQVLINEEAFLRLPQGKIAIGGLDEKKYGQPSARGIFRRAGEDTMRILMCHYPSSVDKAISQAAKMPHLVLCGHTHGGQLSLFGITCYTFGYDKRFGGTNHHFVSGFRKFPEGFSMLVSNGLGESLIPLRIGAPRQMHIIETV